MEESAPLLVRSANAEGACAADVPVVRSIILVVVPMFMAYAALVSFQADIKKRLGIDRDSSAASYAFGEAVSLLFLAALVLRLCHNVLLSWLRPRHRVLLACGLMSVAVGTVAVAFYGFQWRCVPLVFAVYLVGGAAIGTFEANIVSCITPLGHQTKQWAVMGMPVGYNGLAIGGFGLFAAAPHCAALQGAVFGATALACVGGFAWFAFGVPSVPFAASDAQSPAWLISCLRRWREWVPLIKWNLVALFVDMFACILASTIGLYIFDVGDVPAVPAKSPPTIPYNAFQCVFNVCGFAGDFVARKIAYNPPPWWPAVASSQHTPLRFTALTVIGLALCVCKVAVLAPIGFFCIMFGNGMIYASTTRFVDERVPWEFNLVSLSLWLFTGDCGSYIASSLTTPASNAIGRASTG